MRSGFLLLLAVLPLAAPAPARAGNVYAGDLLRVEGDVPEAVIEQSVHLGRRLDAALRARFATEVPAARRPLRLVLYPDRASWRAALAAQAIPRDEHAGGWTDWRTGTSHVWLQPEPFDTRRLVLHELVHQWYARCRERSRWGSGPWWYREGLAESYGWHLRAGEEVRFQAVDVVAANPVARRARVRAADPDFDPWAIAVGAVRADHVAALAVAWGLAHTSDAAVRARWTAWERSNLARGGGAAAFRQAFAGSEDAVRAAVREAWASALPIWGRASPGLDQDGAAVLGRGGPAPAFVFGALDAPLAGVRARCDVRAAGSRAGVFLAQAEAGPAYLGEAGGGTLTISRVDSMDALRAGGAGALRTAARVAFDASRGPVRLALAVEPAGLRLEAGEGERQVVLRAARSDLGLTPGTVLRRGGVGVRSGRARLDGLALVRAKPTRQKDPPGPRSPPDRR
jgi:hypothetical protein